MGKKHVVVILDVNSIPRETPIVDENLRPEDCQEGCASNATTSCNPLPFKYIAVKAIKESVICLLAKEALQYHSEKFDFSQVLWSFKLYNSSYEINSKAGRIFQSLGIESIESFEKQLESYLDLSSVSAIKSDPTVNRAEFLSNSFKSVLGDLPWPEATNEFDELGSGGSDNQNAIYALFKVPRTETELQGFIPGWTPSAGSKLIMSELLPKAFCRKLREHRIKFNFMDLWPACRDECDLMNQTSTTEESMEVSKPILKIVHYLEGSITQFSEVSRGVPLGLPSYGDLIKRLLTESTQPSPEINNSKNRILIDNTQKTIHQLQGSLNGSVIDTNDSESIRSNGNNGNGIRIGNASFALSRIQQRRSYPLPDNQKKFSGFHDDGLSQRQNDYTLPSLSKRFSDEREQLRRRNGLGDVSKKRKFEFEKDMESEDGMSREDIAQWCMGGGGIGSKNKTAAIRKSTKMNATMPAFERERTTNVSHRYKLPAPAHQTISPQVIQPSKRLRRETEPEFSHVMAPPSRKRNSFPNGTHSQQRYSDPVSNMGSHPRENAKSALRSRGSVMVKEGLKKRNSLGRSKERIDEGEGEELTKTTFWKDNEHKLTFLKGQLKLILDQPMGTDGFEPLDEFKFKVKWYLQMILNDEEDSSLPVAAQALVTTMAATLLNQNVRELREAMEIILLVDYTDINMELLQAMQKKNVEKVDLLFRKCLLQIFIHFEMVWTLPVNNTGALEEQFVDDVTRILELVRFYRKDPPIDDFVNQFLIPLYHLTHAKLLREITAALNIHPLVALNNSYDSGSGSARDDCSVSSFNSSMCGPDDSTSQHPLDSSLGNSQSQSMLQNRHHNHNNSQGTSLRTASFLSVNNPKRAIMLPVTKHAAKPKIVLKSQSMSTQSGTLKAMTKSPKPKKVRRNLFDVTAKDPKDMKTLMNLASTSSNSFSKSPSLLFKSPMSKLSCSPRSPARTSPFFALARAAKSKTRSRRRLVMDPEDAGSGTQEGTSTTSLKRDHLWGTLSNSPKSLLCPESPFTPQSTSKVPGSKGSVATSGKSVVQESPEVNKSAYGGSSKLHLSERTHSINSVSFYSIGTDSLKSRAWERSGRELLAARMRSSMELSRSQLLENGELSDEIDQDKDENTKGLVNNRSRKSPSTPHQIKVEPEENVNSSIKALVSNDIVASPSAILNSNLPAKSPIAGGLETPTKRVQFSAELVTTPSPNTPARNPLTPMTPKSILKDTGNRKSDAED